MQKQLVSDAALLKGYLEGNDAALETLIHRYKSRIFSSIYLLVNDRYLAEDIFQETFIKVIHSLKAGKYNDEGKFLPWVIRIARNLCIDHIRQGSKLPTVTDTEGNDIFSYLQIAEPSREEFIINGEEKVSLHALINKLPAEQREVLIMRHYANLSFKEIADMTGSNLNTCIGRMHYAILNLRKMLQKNPVITK